MIIRLEQVFCWNIYILFAYTEKLLEVYTLLIMLGHMTSWT